MTIKENIESLDKQIKDVEIMYYKLQGARDAHKALEAQEAEKNKGKKGEK